MTDPGQSQSDAGFREALALHQQSRLDEAASGYRRVLERNPRHVQALIFLGVIAYESNDFGRALQLVSSALALDPSSTVSLLVRGHSLARLRRFEAALDSYDRAIQQNPGSAAAHWHRADVLAELGRHFAALASYDKALELNPGTAQLHNNRANMLRSLGRYEEAIASYDRAIALAPRLPELYFNCGFALQELKRFEAAIASFTQAIALNPGYAEAYYARGNVQKDLQQLGAALSNYDRAIEIRTDYVEAYINRGNVLGELERFDAALASYESAMALHPGNADAHCNCGSLLSALGRDDEALQNLDRAIAIDPEHAPAHFARAFVYFLQGDLQNGWREFEWRWKNKDCVTSREKREFRQPLWRGEEPIDGKTIVVHCEQGLGDTIQFCRFLTLLARRGAKVIFEVPPPLAQLLRSLPGVAQWVLPGEPLPPFDYCCPLLSLPTAFQTSLGTIPSEIPYLRARPERVQYWRERLGERTKPRVGLVWSGGFRRDQPELWPVNNRRNIPLAKLTALKHPAIDFYSLQKGQPAQSELADSLASGWDGPVLVDHVSELHSFEETAALIEQLDLVISVDTSTAHLAGALGKPVWILNRFDTCWRWLRDRSDSPWYPSVRLYRQERRGDWDEVIQRVRSDLELVAAGSRLPNPTSMA